MFDATSEHVKRSLAASTSVVARKPKDYADRKRSAETTFGAANFADLRRSYYTARVGVIQRYYEVEHYRGRVLEVDPQRVGPSPADHLEYLLSESHVKNTLDPAAWEDAIKSLQSVDDSLTTVRDKWIKQYLSLSIENDRVEILPLASGKRTAADQREAEQLREALKEMRNSTSWRVTEPMRRIITALRRRSQR